MQERIRQAKIKDLDGLLILLSQLSPAKNNRIDKNKLREILKKIILDRNYYLCVYELDRKIVGTAALLIQLNLSHNGRPYGHIENVVTDRSCRGRGIGKKMVEPLIDKARAGNCYKIILDCAKHNILFYQRCKMRETGEVEMRIDL